MLLISDRDNNINVFLSEIKIYNVNNESRIRKTCYLINFEHHNSTYIGQTITTLSRRLTMHLASGGPKQHTTDAHKTI